MLIAKSLVSCLIVTLFLGVGASVPVHAQSMGITLGITVASQKSAYYYREPIKFTGDFKQNGLPVTNGSVGIAVYGSSIPSVPIAYRALRTGPTLIYSPLTFLQLVPCDQNGAPKDSFLPLDTMWLRFTIRNSDPTDYNGIVTLTVFDANGIPLATRIASSGVILANSSPSTFFMGPDIPLTAQPGNATIVACIFSGDPKNGGVPYGEEKKVNFEIKRNPELDYTTAPMSDPNAPSGSFASSLKVTNNLEPGDYQVYVSARSTITNGTQQSLATVQNSTKFSVLNAVMPPQAAFTYYPVDAYVNMTITFDASASTAEGYGVSLVKYEWDFGNGTKISKTTPTISNVFRVANNYTVTLNVTDSQGLWSTTSKIVQILPPTGPVANFTWSPLVPSNLTQVTFDASSTILGWDGVTHPAITNYIWDFGDGNVTSGNYKTIIHRFALAGNYTVKLNVTDASGFKGYTAKIVQVLKGSLPGDVNGNGKVDIFDAILLSGAFGSRPGSPTWNPNADINQDGVVDIFDAIILSNNFGKSG